LVLFSIVRQKRKTLVLCPVVPVAVTAFTEMLFAVGVPLTVGAPLTAAPTPLATAGAVNVTVPVTGTGAVANS